MATSIAKIFTAICNQACTIKIATCSYRSVLEHTLHLPKCFFKNDSSSNKITICPMISEDQIARKYVEFRPNKFGKHVFRFIRKYSNYTNQVAWFAINNENEIYFLDDIIKFLATFMYLDNDIYSQTSEIYPYITDDRNKNLRNKMVQNLGEMYLVKYMYLVSKILSIVEIEIIIIEMLIKLDKWTNLEI